MTEPQNPRMTMLAAAGSILLCVIFGANATAIKISLTGVGKFTAASIRFSLAALTIALWARFSGRQFRVPREQRMALMIICVLFTAQLSFFYLGLSLTLASRAALVVNAVPFFVLIFAHLFLPNDRMTVQKVAGMVLGFIGVALVLRHPPTQAVGVSRGDWIILLATLLWAGNAVYTKTIIAHVRPFQVVLYPMLLAAPVLFLEGWVWDGGMIVRLDGPVIMALIYQSLICAAFGFVAWNTLLKRYGASTLHSFLFIMPVAGVLTAAGMLGEPLTSHLVAAVILVAVGIGMIHFKTKSATPTLPVGRSY